MLLFLAKSSSNLLVLTNIGPHKVEKWLLSVSSSMSVYVCVFGCMCVYLSAWLFICLLSVGQAVCLSFFMKLEFYKFSKMTAVSDLFIFGLWANKTKVFEKVLHELIQSDSFYGIIFACVISCQI